MGNLKSNKHDIHPRSWTYTKDEEDLLNKAKELLIEENLVNAPEYDNIYSPIIAAVRSMFPKLLKFLVDNIDVIDDKAIGDSIRFGLFKEFEILMPPIQDKNILLEDSMNASPLFLAAKFGRVEFFDWLIENGALIKTKDMNKDGTPLIHSAINLEIVKKQVDLELESQDNWNQTALFLSVANKKSSNKKNTLKFWCR